MRRRPDPEALAATWTGALRRGETIVIEQSRLPAVHYLLLVIGMTVSYTHLTLPTKRIV